ncbi:hypothetical protein [Kiloniella sp.]|uniref:hypothetical protein n=1 Tax=Kiloniella sp. TaxID=1938587 RepID=UPI003B019846
MDFDSRRKVISGLVKLGYGLVALYLWFILLLWLEPALAEDLAHNKVEFKELRLQIGSPNPPYLIRPDEIPRDNHRDNIRDNIRDTYGAELDIVREALAFEGYRLNVISQDHTAPLSQETQRLGYQVDAVMGVSRGNELGGCYSRPYIFHRTVAISLSSRDLILDDIEDLRDQRVIGVAEAPGMLGINFSKVFAKIKGYEEVKHQRRQGIELFSGDTDFIVGDLNSFNWIVENGEFPESVDRSQSIAVHPIFPPSSRHLIFRDQSVCDAFNRGMEHLELSGRYQEILNAHNLF